jgi:hypothetical protein
MPTKQQGRGKRPVAVQRTNLGQKEAELEKLGKEQMSHMEGSKSSKTGSAASHQTWRTIGSGCDGSALPSKLVDALR